MRESDLENKLRLGVKALGGKAYKWTSPGNDGVPDRIVILPDHPPIFVELKTETGTLSKLQRVQILTLRNLGQEVHVVKGLRGVMDFLELCKERMCADGI